MTPSATARHARAAEIRTLVELEGKTFTQTADLLGLSRGAIAGITSRHGIKSPNLPSVNKPLSARMKPRAKAAKARQDALARQGEALQQVPELPEAPEPLPAAWAALPGSSPVSLADLGTDQCRWPIGAPSLFCALPVRLDPTGVKTYHYCPAHHALGTRPMPEKERKR